MGRSKKFGRKLNGVLILNKPTGVSSNHALQQAKRLFFANKAGHTGALDPLATGVLPICFGEATKFSQFLLDAEKIYVSTFELGVSTDTADADGCILSETSAAHLDRVMVERAMLDFVGEIQQIPPMYSALKKDGQPLYKLARQGIEVEREARRVTIFEYRLLKFEAGERALMTVRVHCSKGTYIRSLASDIGRILGVGGRVLSLHREQSGQFSDDGAMMLDALSSERGDENAEVLDHHLLPIDTLVSGMPQITVDDDSAFYFGRGQQVMDVEAYQIGDEGDTVRVFEKSGRFLGLAEITDDGCLAPKRLVVY